MKQEELFFTVRATYNEHSFIHLDLKEECDKRGLELKYYREFKTGHIPLYRECKIIGKQWEIKQMLEDLKILYGNYHKENKCAQTLSQI
jgi:hypothetical protein